MSPETQQKILKGLNGMFTDLNNWLSALGLSESQVLPLYIAALREKGLFAGVVKSRTAMVLPKSRSVDVDPDDVVKQLDFFRSEEFAESLLNQPEPEPEELNRLLMDMKNALPNLRRHYAATAKAGPRRRAGGRPKGLPEPEVREEIRSKISSLRRPGTKLKDIFERLAQRYDVRPATIKRIWEEKPAKK